MENLPGELADKLPGPRQTLRQYEEEQGAERLVLVRYSHIRLIRHMDSLDTGGTENRKQVFSLGGAQDEKCWRPANTLRYDRPRHAADFARSFLFSSHL